MSPDLATAARRLAREADELHRLTVSAEAARALAATWPEQDAAWLVERVAEDGIQRRTESVAWLAQDFLAAVQVPA